MNDRPVEQRSDTQGAGVAGGRLGETEPLDSRVGEHSRIMNEVGQQGYLVRTVTDDGVRLDGFLHGICQDHPRSVIVCVHGAASNFYASGFWDDLVPALCQHGYAVLRVNTRGHDGYFTAKTTRGTTRLGAAFEIVADCTRDVAAWVDWCQRHVSCSIILLGHSLGAIKSLYSQAYQPSAAVKGVLALSPPRLSAQVYKEQVPSFRAALAEALQLVDAGQPMRLIESTFPFPMLITAEAFVDKYGGERYNLLTFVPRIKVPMWLVYGEQELVGNPSFAGLTDQLRTLSEVCAVHVTVVKGADHFYNGCTGALASAIQQGLGWMEGGEGALTGKDVPAR